MNFAEFYAGFRAPLNIAFIVVGAVVGTWLLRVLLRAIVNRVVRGVKRSKDVTVTRELAASTRGYARAVQRTRTLGAVGRHIVTWVIAVLAFFGVLNELGVNIAAVMTSAGIVAAGLAFGAQNVVKDILNGIFMVVEDQLGVGDWVQIGDVSGTVEDVGIRVTRVRSLDGTLWAIRNGEIFVLGNSSQGWGRAVVDITVRADQDLQRVADVALAAANGVVRDARFVSKVSGVPEILGLESVFGDRAVLRMLLRTKPEAHWELQRALRAEISKEFRGQGIELAEEQAKFPGSK